MWDYIWTELTIDFNWNLFKSTGFICWYFFNYFYWFVLVEFTKKSRLFNTFILLFFVILPVYTSEIYQTYYAISTLSWFISQGFLSWKRLLLYLIFFAHIEQMRLLFTKISHLILRMTIQCSVERLYIILFIATEENSSH